MTARAADDVTLAMVDARRVERWFFTGVALSMMVLFAVAFTPSFIDTSRRNAPLPLTPSSRSTASSCSPCWWRPRSCIDAGPPFTSV